MLTEVAIAVVESQSRELIARLHQGLGQAILGDVDGFLTVLNTTLHWFQSARAQCYRAQLHL